VAAVVDAVGWKANWSENSRPGEEVFGKQDIGRNGQQLSQVF